MKNQYQNIQQSLSKLWNEASKTWFTEFLNSLGYSSERSDIGMWSNQPSDFIAVFQDKILEKFQNTETFEKSALVSEWKTVDFLFQITQDELFSDTRTNKKLAEKDRFDSYLFFAIELQKLQYSRTELGKISREINRLFDMPVMLLFQYSDKVSLAVSQRRINRIDETKDVILKSVILKDISCKNPRNAHIRILTEMSKEVVLKRMKNKGFEDFHTALIQTLSKSELNKQFYGHIQNFFSRLDRSNELKDAILQDGIRYDENAESEKIQHGALRLILRLLFVHFLSEKGGIVSDLNGNPLIEHVKLNAGKNTGGLHANLESLFFDALNRRSDDTNKSLLWSKTKYLNGGLFSKKIEDGDGAITLIPDVFYYNPDFRIENFNKDSSKQDAGIFNIFESFVFTVEEGNQDDVTFGVDPEMLGNILENILGSIINEETKESARKANGAFYTPKEIVDYMVRSSLYEALSEKFGITDSIDLDGLTSRIREEITAGKMKKEFFESTIESLKILDPACGSWAFPMGILSVMTELVQKVLPNQKTAYEIKLWLMENCLYGVDIKPMAVEMCHLRYFLSLLEDMDTANVESIPHEGVLPNLHFKFSVANTLIKLESGSQSSLTEWDVKQFYGELSDIRKAYFHCHTEVEKARLESQYEGYLSKTMSEKLKNYQPFKISESAGFYDAELFHGIKNGFDIVIGNPPYFWLSKLKNQPDIQKAYIDAQYEVHSPSCDIYCLFYERGLSLSKPNTWLLSFITSNKWMRTGYGEKLRTYFVKFNPKTLIDCWAGIFESATVDVNILLIQNTKEKKQSVNALKLVKNTDKLIANSVRDYWIVLSELSQDPWFIWTPEEISLKKKIEWVWKILKDWDLKISYGIKTGYNKAFIIDKITRDRLVTEDEKNTDIIKPILRGRDIKRYGHDFAQQYLIVVKYWFAKDLIKYPSILNHLKQFEDELRKRGQCNSSETKEITNWVIWETGQHHWLELDNNPSDNYLKKLEVEKIVYSEIVREPQFHIDMNKEFYIEASAFIITGKYLKYLCGILNSNSFTYFFKNWYAGGWLGDDWFRYKKCFLETVPVPMIIPRNQIAISAIESLTTQIIESKKSNPNANTQLLEDNINSLVYGLYELTYDEVLLIESAIAMTRESYDAFIQKHFKSLEIQKSAISKHTKMSLEELKSFIQPRLDVLNAHQRVRIFMPQDSKLQSILDFPEQILDVPGIDRRFVDLLGDEIQKLLK